MKHFGLKSAFFALALSCLFYSAPSEAQTRAVGSLVIEANAKYPDVSGELDLVFAFEPTAVSSETVATLLIYNPTDGELTSLVGTILNAHFRFLGNAYPGVGGTCGKTLAPKSTCTVKMRFAPQTEGLKRGLVRINYWEGGLPRTSYRQLIGN